MIKRLDFELFDEIAARAAVSERRRMHYDLRTSADEAGWTDMSQRILNVMKKDTVIPVHRHMETNEVVIVMRGSGCEVIYDAEGNELERVDLVAGSECSGVVVPRGEWHTFIAHEDDTTILEAKDRPYDAVRTEELLVL